jgi:hypothetical protein
MTNAFRTASILRSLIRRKPGYSAKRKAAEGLCAHRSLAQRNADGSVTVQFGGCDGNISNCVPIMQGNHE